MRNILLFLFLITAVSCSRDKKPDSGFISVGNLKVYYESSGEGDPVMLLHAGFQDLRMWDKQVEALKKEHRVIAIDLPGHGKTTGKDTTLIELIMKTVLDSLQIPKVSLVGLSLGAGIVQDIAIAYPGQVNKIVLISGSINGFEEQYQIDSLSIAWFPAMMNALSVNDTQRAARVFTKSWSEGPYRDDTKLSNEYNQYVYNTTLKNMLVHKISGWPFLKTDPSAMENIHELKHPVLLIHGDKDVPHIRIANMMLNEKLPQAKRVMLKDAAHMLNLEKPDEVNKLLVDFLKP